MIIFDIPHELIGIVCHNLSTFDVLKLMRTCKYFSFCKKFLLTRNNSMYDKRIVESSDLQYPYHVPKVISCNFEISASVDDLKNLNVHNAFVSIKGSVHNEEDLQKVRDYISRIKSNSRIMIKIRFRCKSLFFLVHEGEVRNLSIEITTTEDRDAAQIISGSRVIGTRFSTGRKTHPVSCAIRTLCQKLFIRAADVIKFCKGTRNTFNMASSIALRKVFQCKISYHQDMLVGQNFKEELYTWSKLSDCIGRIKPVEIRRCFETSTHIYDSTQIYVSLILNAFEMESKMFPEFDDVDLWMSEADTSGLIRKLSFCFDPNSIDHRRLLTFEEYISLRKQLFRSLKSVKLF